MTADYDLNFGVITRSVDFTGAEMTYEYDQAIEFTYDFSNRLLSENFVNSATPGDPVDVVYTYDVASQGVDFGDGTTGSAAFTTGRFASVRDLTGEEHLSYDQRGNVL